MADFTLVLPEDIQWVTQPTCNLCPAVEDQVSEFQEDSQSYHGKVVNDNDCSVGFIPTHTTLDDTCYMKLH